MTHVTLDQLAGKIADKQPAVARDFLTAFLIVPEKDDDHTERLDFNAHLCTRLREIGAAKQIWEDGDVSAC